MLGHWRKLNLQERFSRSLATILISATAHEYDSGDER